MSFGYDEAPRVTEGPAGPELCDDFHHIFTTPQGERALEHLEWFSHYKRPTITGTTSGLDSNAMMINEGKRLVILEILSHLAAYEEKGTP